jgi:hypothetical protein
MFETSLQTCVILVLTNCGYASLAATWPSCLRAGLRRQSQVDDVGSNLTEGLLIIIRIQDSQKPQILMHYFHGIFSK